MPAGIISLIPPSSGDKQTDGRQILREYKARSEEVKEFDPRSVLYSELLQVLVLFGIAKETYTTLPDGENAQSLVLILKELRGITKDLFELTQKDRANLLHELDQGVFQPFFRDIVQEFLKEMNNCLNSLTSTLGEENYEAIEGELMQSQASIPAVLSLAYKNLLRKASKLLDIPADDLEPLVEGAELRLKQAQKKARREKLSRKRKSTKSSRKSKKSRMVRK